MSIKKARKTLQNKEKFNYDILDKVANSGGKTVAFPMEQKRSVNAAEGARRRQSVLNLTKKVRKILLVKKKHLFYG